MNRPGFRPVTRVSLVVFLVACHGPKPAAPPSYQPVATEAAPPRAALYANCISEAAQAQRYVRAADDDADLILFTCVGEPAKAFYDGLAEHSARIGSEVALTGKTLRTTQKVQQNLFGVDYCSSDGRAYECVVTLNAGAFLR